MSTVNAEGTILVRDVQLSVTNCGVCGGSYALSQKCMAYKRQHGGYWNCPYCKQSWGYGTSEIDEKNNEITRLKRTIEYAETDLSHAKELKNKALHSARTIKGHLTRTKNRIANGVCPCCNRSFKNLHNQMSRQHPDYTEK